MRSGDIENIAEELLQTLPVIGKKLLRSQLDGARGRLSRLHLAVMRMLEGDSLTISEVARRLVVPKPQMTRLIDHLVRLGVVARQPDARDRRVVNISLTDDGKAVLEEYRQLMKQSIKDKLAHLTPSELAELSALLGKLREIGKKLL